MVRIPVVTVEITTVIAVTNNWSSEERKFSDFRLTHMVNKTTAFQTSIFLIFIEADIAGRFFTVDHVYFVVAW